MPYIDPDNAYTKPVAPQTFFFYDLETSGLNPREDRIMQFAGQRTDMKLNPIGDPVNLLIKMADDTLPGPYAIMVTGITPQSTQADGLSEAEFCRYLSREIFTPNTCAVGFNSVRFDDEFMRHLFWRNFYDPYEWQWKDGRSRWDLLDVVRLTRALRPEGIVWPVGEQGQAVNKLELITKENGITHEHAHDALSDVEALISVTKLIKEKQPKLYEFLFKIRAKKEVQALVNLEKKNPFIYASGRYSGEFNNTTVAFPFTAGRNGNVLVFDLRHNLDEILEKKLPFFPTVKELSYNKCPAVAPIGVLESENGWEKIGLSRETIERNLKSLLSHPEFAEQMRSETEKDKEWPKPFDPESALYEAFLPNEDRRICDRIRYLNEDELSDYMPEFADSRLAGLLLHYKAKNFVKALTSDEIDQWEEYRKARIARQLPKFMAELEELRKIFTTGGRLANGNKVDGYLLEELTLWLQSISDLGY